MHVTIAFLNFIRLGNAKMEARDNAIDDEIHQTGSLEGPVYVDAIVYCLNHPLAWLFSWRHVTDLTDPLFLPLSPFPHSQLNPPDS